MNKQELIKKYKRCMGCSRSRNSPSNFSTRLGTTRRTAETSSTAVCGGFYLRTEKTGAYIVLLNRRKYV